ncbi:MAG: ComEC/Rec2 family competence protein [Candidatus Omnitrophota bacterium]
MDFRIALLLAILPACLIIISGVRVQPLFSVLFCALIFILGVLLHANFNTLSKNDICNIRGINGRVCHLNGIVKSLPSYAWQRWGNRRCSFLFNTLHCDTGVFCKKASGLIWVTIRDNNTEYEPGDNMIIRGAVNILSDLDNKNSRGYYAKYLRLQGIRASLNVESDDDIVSAARPRRIFSEKYLHQLRRGIERRIKRYLSYPDSGLLNAILLGRRESMPKDISALFIKTGTIHILSVSGLHVGLLSAMLFFCLRFLCLPQKYIIAAVIVFLWVYVFIAGARAPIVRASVMVSVYLLSTALERDFDIYASLFFAGFLILLINPMQVFSAGFQLSFSCVFFIAYLCPKLESVFSPVRFMGVSDSLRKKASRSMVYLSKTFFSSLAVFIGVWPIVAYHFGIISPVTIAANLFVVPLLAVILSSGIILVCIPAVFVPLVRIFSCASHILFYLLLNIVRLFSSLPCASFDAGAMPLWFIGAYYIILLIVVESLPDRNMMWPMME